MMQEPMAEATHADGSIQWNKMVAALRRGNVERAVEAAEVLTDWRLCGGHLHESSMGCPITRIGVDAVLRFVRHLHEGGF